MYNLYGSTSEGRSFDEQRHQIGPFASLRFGKTSVFMSVLAGFSSGSPDTNLRLGLGRAF